MPERQLTPIYIDKCPKDGSEIKGVFLRPTLNQVLQICPTCSTEYPVRMKEWEDASFISKSSFSK